MTRLELSDATISDLDARLIDPSLSTRDPLKRRCHVCLLYPGIGSVKVHCSLHRENFASQSYGQKLELRHEDS